MLDLIHMTGFLDGLINFVLLDFVLFNWDKVLRSGRLLSKVDKDDKEVDFLTISVRFREENQLDSEKKKEEDGRGEVERRRFEKN
ncbi:hypothetical protein CsSME_00012804 [Camellia sinensis var. sinensis]